MFINEEDITDIQASIEGPCKILFFLHIFINNYIFSIFFQICTHLLY